MHFNSVTSRFAHILILLAVVFDTNAQQYFLKNYSVESGLPFVQVYGLHQDSSGYLWSGGYGGLSRFDGKAFVNYNRKNGLIDHNVNAILSAENSLFVGTNKGLSVYHNRKFRNYARMGRVVNPIVTSFCRGYHHSIYIGTRSGLFMYKNDSVHPVGKLKSFSINCLLNPDTNVIFAGTDQGLVIFGHKTFKIMNAASGLPGDKVISLAMFCGSLVIGTPEGMAALDSRSGKVTLYDKSNGLLDNDVSVLYGQHNEFLWIGSPRGLLRFDGKTFERFTVEQDNHNMQVRCIIEDREKNIWLGTHNGLYRYRDNSFSVFNEKGLHKAFTFQILRDGKDNLWVASQHSGIYRIKDGKVFQYGPAQGVEGNTARSGIVDSRGRILFGVGGKLMQFDNETFHEIPIDPAFEGSIEVMHESPDHVLWMGGSNGVCSLTWIDGKPHSKFYPIHSPRDFVVYGFCQDSSGALYAGTFKGGLFKLINDSLHNISAGLKLNEETFFTLRYTQGKIFAASLNGVLVLDIRTGALKRINDEDGLNSELVYSIEFSNDMRHLWIGTNQGINRLDLQKFLANGTVEIKSYGKQEGFSGVECNSNGIWEDKDGTLWFGTVSGLVRYQPFNYMENKTETNTLLQNVRLMNEDTLLADSAVLKSDLNTISFYYRGICLTNPDKVQYQWRLLGLKQDEDWSEPSQENYIKYTNLAPGKYEFQVRSCNNEGLWNSQATSFVFTILSPFYLTWWFILLCSLGLFAGIYTVFMVRIYNFKKHQRKEFERRVEMSKIELKALRAQMNPHFIFNSLNAIQHYIFHTRSDEAIKYLNKFAKLVRLILSNSEKPTVTVGEDLDALRLYLELEQMRFDDKFDYSIEVDTSVDPDYDIMPPLLMQPYVENAILHGLNPKPVKGHLSVRLHSENNFLICTITDNGIGREKAAEIRRTMPMKRHKSMGMKITEDRLRIMNELNNSHLSVTVTDLKDEQGASAGTMVELFIPLAG